MCDMSQDIYKITVFSALQRYLPCPRPETIISFSRPAIKESFVGCFSLPISLVFGQKIFFDSSSRAEVGGPGPELESQKCIQIVSLTATSLVKRQLAAVREVIFYLRGQSKLINSLQDDMCVLYTALYHCIYFLKNLLEKYIMAMRCVYARRFSPHGR